MFAKKNVGKVRIGYIYYMASRLEFVKCSSFEIKVDHINTHFNIKYTNVKDPRGFENNVTLSAPKKFSLNIQ